MSVLFAPDYHWIHTLIRFSPEAECRHRGYQRRDERLHGWHLVHGDICGFIDDLSLRTKEGQFHAKQWEWWACTHEVQRERVTPHPDQTWIRQRHPSAYR